MLHPNILVLCATALGEIPADKTLEERLLYAFKRVHTHQRDIFWIVNQPLNDDIMFRTAVAAVGIAASKAGKPEEVRLLEKSLKPLQALSALMEGIPVDFGRIDIEGCIPLVKLWNEGKV